MKYTKFLIFAAMVLLGISSCFAADVNILDYGASVDAENNAAAIQKAIDDCAEKGGGTVHFPAGTFVSNTVFMKSNVDLYLHKQSVVKGSGNFPADYSTRAVVYAEGIENAAIYGEGTIDGNGGHKNFPSQGAEADRPHLVWFVKCKNIKIKDVNLVNSAFWTLKLTQCDGVRVNGIRIYGHVRFNNDGIDIESKNVIISDCRIDADDDVICFKNVWTDYVVENVTVTNCVLATTCNGIKFGTGSVGGFRNITINNCVINAASEDMRHWKKHLRGITTDITAISGIALEVVDGGFIDNVVISNISMQNVQTPIFVRLGGRKNPPGILKNVVISGITATSESLMASTISGIPGHCVENITLRDIVTSSPGGGTKADAERAVPENIKGYPENRMFGDSLPAHSFYVRHARNIVFDNVQCGTRTPDERPAFVFDDAENITRHHVQELTPAGNK